jgi:hypothetical protein
MLPTRAASFKMTSPAAYAQRGDLTRFSTPGQV